MYGLLAIMLAITAVFIAIFVLNPSITDYVIHGDGFWLMPFGWSGFIVLYVILICPCCCNAARRTPLNLILLGLLASFMGISLGALCCFYDFKEIAAAGFGTVCIVLGVTGLTFMNFFDITKVINARIFQCLIYDLR